MAETRKEMHFNLEEALGKFPNELQDRAREVARKCEGRHLRDAMAILSCAEKEGKFDSYVDRLGEGSGNNYWNLRDAVEGESVFFAGLFVELGADPAVEMTRL